MRSTRLWLSASALIALAILVLALTLTGRAPDHSALSRGDSEAVGSLPTLRGHPPKPTETQVVQADAGPGVAVRILNRASGNPVPGIHLLTSVGEYRADDRGTVVIPPEVSATLRPVSDLWRCAPQHVDSDGVLWVVGRLRVRAYCIREGMPVPESKGKAATVTVTRPVGVTIADMENPATRERDRWLQLSKLSRERHRLPVLPGGAVEILTWETPSQALRVSLNGATSAAVPIPNSGAQERGDAPPIVEMQVLLDEQKFNIAGRVVTADGIPVQDADVLVVLLRRIDAEDADPSGLQPVGHTMGVIKRGSDAFALVSNKLEATTGPDGQFSLATPVDADETLLLVHHPGFTRGSQRLGQLSSADRSDVELRLTPAPQGAQSALRVGQQPVPEGSIVFVDVDSEPQYHFQVEVSAEGRFPTTWLEVGRMYHLVYHSKEDGGLVTGSFRWHGAANLDYEDIEGGRSIPAAGGAEAGGR